MSLKGQFRIIRRNVKKEISIYQAVLKDKRTPPLGKLLLSMAIGYFFMPFDLIPDFIPVLGHIDDAIIIPALIFFALKVIPKAIVQEHRKRVESQSSVNQ